MGQLLQILLDNLHKIWPIRVIDANQQGVRFDRGKNVTLLRPGVHWFIPGLQRIDKGHTIYQQLDCGLQSMQTKDDVSVTFSINVGYTVLDAAQVVTRFYNFDHTLQCIARGRLGEIVNATLYADLQQRLPEIARSMRLALRKEVRESGVRIKDVRLDEFAKTRQYRLLGGSAN